MLLRHFGRFLRNRFEQAETFRPFYSDFMSSKLSVVTSRLPACYTHWSMDGEFTAWHN